MKVVIMTQSELKEIVNYVDGNLVFKIRLSNRVKIGDIAGSPQNTGYTATSLRGEKLLNHRLVWIWHYGDIPNGMVIDHIDRDRLNNRIENLRLLTPAENKRNNEPKGWVYSRGYYVARIGYENKTYTIRNCSTKEEASELYYQAKSEIHKYDSQILTSKEVKTILKKYHKEIQRNNTSGVVGIRVRGNKYQATIFITGKKQSIGTFDTLEEASSHREFVLAAETPENYIIKRL